MRRYELVASKVGCLLVEADSELLVRRVIDRGRNFKEILNRVVYLGKNDDFGTILIFNKDKTEIIKKIDNVRCFDYKTVDDYVVFSADADYFLIDGENVVSLGSWLENKVFLQKEEKLTRASYFVNGKLISKVYKSVSFCSEDSDYPVVFESLDVTPEGYPLYDIFVSAEPCEGLGSIILREVGEWFRIYLNQDQEDSLVQHFCRYGETNMYVKVYEGENEINFDNAVGFFDEESKLYKLYGVDAYQLVLWGEGEEYEEDNYFIRIGNRIWRADEYNVYLLQSEPETVEEAKEAEKEETSEPDSKVVSDGDSSSSGKRMGSAFFLKKRLWPW